MPRHMRNSLNKLCIEFEDYNVTNRIRGGYIQKTAFNMFKTYHTSSHGYKHK